jgi:hypothetical protein
MPGFDRTGPRGQGPMTGRGEGYRAAGLPDEVEQPAQGYAGWQDTPAQAGPPTVRPTLWAFLARLLRPMWLGRLLWGRGRGFWGRGLWGGRGRGRGRRWW